MSKPPTSAQSFELLVSAIGKVHAEMAAQAGRAVNMSLTLRNWVIGFYIEEYERHGVDRQQYGEKLLDRLAEKLVNGGVSRCDRRELYRYRQFYLSYPQIVESLPPQLLEQFGLTARDSSLQRRIVESANPQSWDTQAIGDSLTPEFRMSGKDIVNKLSFTHIAELLKCDDATQRAFYEVECIRGNWSVRELKRQIASLYYERSGLSTDKKKLADHVLG